MTRIYSNKGLLRVGDYDLENNAWGTVDPFPPQAVLGPPDDLIGWHWDWPSGSPDKIMAYPEIIFGKKPFNRFSTTKLLPRAIGRLNNLNVDLSFHTSGTGAFNSTFDLWITNSETAAERDITAEVMIWLSTDGLTPAGVPVCTVNTANGASTFYKGKMQFWNYYAFVFERETTGDNIDLKDFLNYLIKEGLISTGDFLASVEFGNEIAFGKGSTNLISYSVHCS